MEIDFIIPLVLVLMGVAAFTISTVSGGGGALILVPILNWLIGTSNTAPVLNLGTFIGRPARIIIFFKHIQWSVFFYYVPSAIIGAWLGSWLFSSFDIGWIRLFVGVFLVSTVFQYKFGKKKRSFNVYKWHFIPIGFIVSIISTIVGGMGPVLNPFYLNLGLEKEKLIATKTANSFFMGVAQISSYGFFGLLTGKYWWYGVCLGIGAVVGNIIGKKFLSSMKNRTFRVLLITIMVISGVILIIKEL